MKPESALSHYVPTLDDVGLDLLSRMLRYNVAGRPQAAECVAHPYFQDVRDEWAAVLQAHARAHGASIELILANKGPVFAGEEDIVRRKATKSPHFAA